MLAGWKSIMRQFAPPLFTCVWLMGTALAAQTASDVGESIELTRTAIQAKRQTIISQSLDLTEEEDRAFWPLYREYQTASASLDDRVAEMVTNLMVNYDRLTDEEAEDLIDQWLDVQTKRHDLTLQYAKRFREILPEKKALRYLQLENKLDAIVSYSLSETVPLAEQ